MGPWCADLSAKPFWPRSKGSGQPSRHKRGIEKRLRRSHIFIARETRKAASSVGATSNQDPPYMPLLAELIAFHVTVAIKISLLRSWESCRLNQAPRQITSFNPALA